MCERNAKKYNMEGASIEYSDEELMLIEYYRMADKKIKHYIFELVKLMTKDSC